MRRCTQSIIRKRELKITWHPSERQATNEEIDQAIRRVGLEPTDKRTFRKYSLGMKQRLMLAQAIMEQPEVLIVR